MKELNKVDGLCKQTQDCVRTAYEKGYNDGFNDGKQAMVEAFEREELLGVIVDYARQKCAESENLYG